MLLAEDLGDNYSLKLHYGTSFLFHASNGTKIKRDRYKRKTLKSLVTDIAHFTCNISLARSEHIERGMQPCYAEDRDFSVTMLKERPEPSAEIRDCERIIPHKSPHL